MPDPWQQTDIEEFLGKPAPRPALPAADWTRAADALRPAVICIFGRSPLTGFAIIDVLRRAGLGPPPCPQHWPALVAAWLRRDWIIRTGMWVYERREGTGRNVPLYRFIVPQ